MKEAKEVKILADMFELEREKDKDNQTIATEIFFKELEYIEEGIKYSAMRGCPYYKVPEYITLRAVEVLLEHGYKMVCINDTCEDYIIWDEAKLPGRFQEKEKAILVSNIDDWQNVILNNWYKISEKVEFDKDKEIYVIGR